MSKPTCRELLEDAKRQTACIPYYEILAARVGSVLALHVPRSAPPIQICAECSDGSLEVEWPCRTRRLLDGEEP